MSAPVSRRSSRAGGATNCGISIASGRSPRCCAAADPFGSDAGAVDSATSERVEELAAEREDVAEQMDQQAEVGAAEVEDAAGQRDQQAEMEAVQ